MEAEKWIIKNGTIVNPEYGEIKADIKIEDGVISAIGKDLCEENCAVYDAAGKYVFPGFIDTHVHLGNFNSFEDDCRTETISAAAGGVTTVCQMAKASKLPQYRPPQTSYHEVLGEISHIIESNASVDVALHLNLSSYEQIDEIPSYAQLGHTSYKFFMSYVGMEGAIKMGAIGVRDGIIYAALDAVSKVPGTLAIVHCENDDLIEYFQRSLTEKDKENISFSDFSNSRPPIAEAENIHRLLFYAAETGAAVYLPHVSSIKAVDVAKEARKNGVKAFIETCPQYLVLTCEDAGTKPGAVAKVTPTMRGRDTLEYLWECVKDGTIDTIGSDHCSIGLDRKQSVWSSPGGFPGIETIAPLVITEAQKRGIPLQRVSQILSYNAARILGMLPHKGTLRIGADADIAVLDLNKEGVIAASRLHSSSTFTPYEGMKTKASVEATFLRGSLIWKDGVLLKANAGRTITRKPLEKLI
ncbi:MAG: amidohydrolase family protein [Pyramidobacter sp.]|nr:amidohydrolase family protein [Pyramidobacter sp.]